LRNREIADALAMSEGTVKVYLHTMYQKLGIKNRTELALIAVTVGVLVAVRALSDWNRVYRELWLDRGK